ncbi:hypothetical protein NUW54_g5054 [Trametes sanguinea]|uniref:Uncharacterized protein n=1 Tax=Trametes sanguinea TaxID=158606 RepID=A0ACC1PW79_9APHY|nr:hypothetical protein NUW54_g5054 [Trametes sanguinea]
MQTSAVHQVAAEFVYQFCVRVGMRFARYRMTNATSRAFSSTLQNCFSVSMASYPSRSFAYRNYLLLCEEMCTHGASSYMRYHVISNFAALTGVEQ